MLARRDLSLCLWGSLYDRQVYSSICSLSCGVVSVCSLFQCTIKLTFADQPSTQKDHLDAYKAKPEIAVSGLLCVVWCEQVT